MTISTKVRTTAELGMLGACLLMASCSKKAPEPTPAAAGAVPATGAAVQAKVAIKPAAIVASPEACQKCVASTRCGVLPECSSLAGDARTDCEAVEKCVQTSNCADGQSTFTDCFCGKLTMGACVDAPTSGAGAPAGVCASVIRKALGGDQASNKDILTRFTKRAVPGGVAIARMNCSKEKGCATECGF